MTSRKQPRCKSSRASWIIYRICPKINQASRLARCWNSIARTCEGGPCPTLTIRALQRCACIWTTTTLAARPAANFSSTRKMPQNLSICAVATQAMRISMPGFLVANRKLSLFHTFFILKNIKQQPELTGGR